MPLAEAVSQRREQKTEPDPSAGRPAPKRQRNADSVQDSPGLLKRVITFALAGLLVLIAYKIATGEYYTPRSNFGFYLGVAGSSMMLAMLLYPLRKRARFMHRLGALKHWFRWHMIMGIVGPTLILFHSTFHLRSLNATIAMVSMLIVVASGVIGRFVYTQIHYGLYGRRASLDLLQQEFAGQSTDMRSRFHMVPRVEEWLKDFERRTGQVEPSFTTMWGHLFVLGWKRRICAFRCARELRKVLQPDRHPEFREGAPEAVHLITRYLKEAERVAEFTVYERLFSLWHILHIPLIFLLAASTIFHIIAIYMY